MTTTNELACIECGVPSPATFIKEKQRLFFKKLFGREGFNQTHLHRIIELAKQVKSPCGVYINALDLDNDYVETWFQRVRASFTETTSTRKATYIGLNPTLSVSKLYTEQGMQEFKRIA
eukprot:GHVT01079370.1.p1 GENE.GHVT01079370.1~~GHVT01079370.1.p1  ORF type:complete len:119 (+),score=7.83 GHVT01079370.1:203-559(+)